VKEVLAYDVGDAAPEDEGAIRALMRRVIEADVTQEPRLLQETLANVNGNVDLWLAQPARCVHLKATRDGAVVGVVLVKDFWNLCSLFVASEHQGHGIGRQLVDAAAGRCAGQSPKSALWLNAATGAIPFYQRLGFVARASTRALPPGFQAMQRPL